MAQPEEFILKDVRCFEGEQRGRLRPITLLVGENSTGKSTFLACLSVFHRMFSTFQDRNGGTPDFNRGPISMGSFRDIVRSRRGPSGRIDEFQLGLKFARHGRTGFPTEILVTFEEQGSQPAQHSCLYRFGPSEFFELRQNTEGKTTLAIPGRELDVALPSFRAWHFGTDFLLDSKELQRSSPDANAIVSYVRDLLEPGDDESRGVRLIRSRLRELFRARLISVAPLRVKPKRAYDPVMEIDSPEGEHIPMLMMRLKYSDKKRWRSLHDELVDFGKKSGLFADIKVRRHGKQISDPFQLQVKVQSSSHANIMDVGGGVSQSLPILVSLLSGDGNDLSGGRYHSEYTTFLLQQPEVNLHPRGQAELAELFAKVAKEGRNRFLIETHSDYIVDRMRILVRKKMLRPDDVSIIFFEPRRNTATIHNIDLDEFGNVKNAPPSYRSFFLKETDRLLGFDDGASRQCA